jgi:ubiquinone/menaquinone biosynthesis C-methylase UbiE
VVNVVQRARAFGALVLALAKSPAAREQLRHILARQEPVVHPEEPEGPDFVDVRKLLETLTIDELSRTAEEYFQRHDDIEMYVAMPFNNSEDAPDLVIAFCQVLAGLRPPYGSTILEFGAGTCWAARFLTQMRHSVIAMDVSPTALEMGRATFRRLPVAGHHVPPTFTVFDGHRFDLRDASVDRIMCLNAFHHVPNPAEVLKEMARVLRPGGIAGFSEPGSTHSRSVQAQYEMRNYTVVENDIVIEDIERWALDAGFERMELAVFDTRSYRLNWPDYENLVAGGVAAERYVDFMRQAAAMRRAFFLYKAGTIAPDSRERRGLGGSVKVTLDNSNAVAGGVFTGVAEVVNTGANAWLPSDAPFGPVLLGIHLFSRDGSLINRDYGRVWLPHGIAPGESARIRFEIPAPPAGDFRFGFDLVSEQVCWFEMTGSEVALVDVSVRA